MKDKNKRDLYLKVRVSQEEMNAIKKKFHNSGMDSQRRALPHDYTPYSTVYNFYRRVKQKGVWEKVMQFLVNEIRIQTGRNAEPSYALIDSQSVKTAYRSDKKGYDGGKKQKE